VYPREVERVIGAMPGVCAVRVAGVPDAASGHQVAAEVVVDATAGVSESDVRTWAERGLSAYKRPTRIVVTATP